MANLERCILTLFGYVQSEAVGKSTGNTRCTLQSPIANLFLLCLYATSWGSEKLCL